MVFLTMQSMSKGSKESDRRSHGRCPMSDDSDSTKQQRLIDALQVAALTAQRVALMSKQQHQDASDCLCAVERAIAEVKPIGKKGGA